MSNDYYLVAKYKDIEEPSVIAINSNWYLNNGIESFNRGNDISSIDIITTKFKSLEEMKEQMYKTKYIKSKEVDLFITHSHKYNNKEYLNEYELIFNNGKDRMDLFKKLSRKKQEKRDILLKDTDNLINRFLKKCYSRKSFYIFMTNPYSKVDKYIIDKIMKNKELNYSIKYSLKDKITNYLTIRNIISMWNLYDELRKKYENDDEIELGKKITKDYIEILNSRNNRKEIHKEIKEKTNKNYIEGQINMDEYLKEKEISYEEGMQNLLDKANELRERPFDDPYIQKLYNEGGIEKAIQIPSDIRNSLSLEDKYKLGLVGDVVDYLNLKRKNNGKTHN